MPVGTNDFSTSEKIRCMMKILTDVLREVAALENENKSLKSLLNISTTGPICCPDMKTQKIAMSSCQPCQKQDENRDVINNKKLNTNGEKCNQSSPGKSERENGYFRNKLQKIKSKSCTDLTFKKVETCGKEPKKEKARTEDDGSGAGTCKLNQLLNQIKNLHETMSTCGYSQ